MADPVTITLGGRDFTVRPLTIGQFRQVYPAIFKGAGLSSDEGYDQAVRCIAAAVGRDHPEMTVQAVLELETNTAELAQAFVAVMRLAGLKTGASPGEVKAGPAAVAPGSAGPTSTDASQPLAATPGPTSTP
jgi:hypothetical protein